MYKVITADIMNWLNLASRYNYRQSYYHAMLLDPPYHLTSIVKRFSKGTPAKYRKDGAFQRASKGFMGQTWDGGDLAFNPELWAALKDMLLPGAFCFAFAGSRGWHRMATAIEDAGFIMHPTLFLWAYGSGFPKATNISTQLDKAAGVEREIVREKKQSQGPESMLRRKAQSTQGYRPEGKEFGQLAKDTFSITAPATPEAAQWQSHRYGLQAIKPATEPILCFQKPYEGRPLDNITTTGAGALNIDGGRIGTNKRIPGSISQEKPNANIYGTYGIETGNEDGHNPNIGRWPSNLILSHHPDCKRVGVKRVKPKDGSGVVGDTTRRSKTMNVYGKYKDIQQKGFTHLDSDGLETVADWQCVEGGSFSTYQYVHNGVVLLPSSAPASLLGLLQDVLQDLHNYSKNDNNLLHNVSEVYYNGHKLSEVSEGDLLDAVLYALSVSSLPDFQFDCQPCLHLCDGLLRPILMACQDGLPSLLDVLDYVYQYLLILERNQQIPNISPRSNLDVLDLQNRHDDTQPNNISDSDLSPQTSLEIASHNEDSQLLDALQSEKHDNISDYKTFVNDSRKTPCCNAHRTVVVKLLCLMGIDLAWRFCLPAHIIQRSETVTNYEGCPVKKLDEQSKNIHSAGYKRGKFGDAKATWGTYGEGEAPARYGDSGSASRFFYQSHFACEVYEQIIAEDPVRYVAKVSNKERNAGLTKPNIHPTLKPIALTKYLASLLLPPDSYAPRRIIIPFFGSGSDGIGALLAGWDEVTGIEMTKKYIPIANARLKWWSHWLKWGQDDIDVILATQDDDQQLSFLEKLD